MGFADESIRNVHRATSIPGKFFLDDLNHNSTQCADIADRGAFGRGLAEGADRGKEGAAVLDSGATVVNGIALGHLIRNTNIPGTRIESGQIADESGPGVARMAAIGLGDCRLPW